MTLENKNISPEEEKRIVIDSRIEKQLYSHRTYIFWAVVLYAVFSFIFFLLSAYYLVFHRLDIVHEGFGSYVLILPTLILGATPLIIALALLKFYSQPKEDKKQKESEVMSYLPFIKGVMQEIQQIFSKPKE